MRFLTLTRINPIHEFNLNVPFYSIVFDYFCENSLWWLAFGFIVFVFKYLLCVRTSLLFCFQSVTLHTDVGDIKIEVFCEECPKTAEVSVFIFHNILIYHRYLFINYLYCFLFVTRISWHYAPVIITTGVCFIAT